MPLPTTWGRRLAGIANGTNGMHTEVVDPGGTFGTSWFHTFNKRLWAFQIRVNQLVVGGCSHE
jgi:hypothetical protein